MGAKAHEWSKATRCRPALESQRDLTEQKRPLRKTLGTHRRCTRIKYSARRRHMSKSQVQQNTSEKRKIENIWKEKKHEMWNYIHTDLKRSSNGKYYFGWWPFLQSERKAQRETDEEGVHAPYYMVVVRENCNHLWLTWNTSTTMQDIIFL